MPDLSLTKEKNFLDDRTIYETCDVDFLCRLLASGKLSTNWERSNFAIDKAQKLYSNEVKQIESYVAKYDYSVGGVPVEYRRARHGWGRAYGNRSLCLSNMYRHTRHTLAAPVFYDIDIKNCQVEILRQVCRDNNVHYPRCLDEYCEKREEVMAYHLEYCGLPMEHRKIVKRLFLRLIFCGSWYGFRKSVKEEYGFNVPEKPTKFCQEFKQGLATAGKEIMRHNTELRNVAINNKERKASQTEVVATFISLYLQEQEARVLGSVIEEMSKAGLMSKGDKVIGSYEYDGFKVVKSKADAFEYNGFVGRDAVCKYASDIAMAQRGFDLVFEEKPMDDVMDLSHVTDDDIKKVKQRLMEKPMKQQGKDDDVSIYLDTVTDFGVCFIIAEHTNRSYLFLMPEKRWITWDGKHWKPDDVALWKNTPTIVREYVENKFAHYEWTDISRHSLDAFIARIETYKHLHGVVKLAEKMFAEYSTKFDLNTDLLGFDNGVYDIASSTFRPSVKEDYVTMSCGYDFNPETDEEEEVYKEEVMKVLSQIHPIDEHREFFLMVLASGLSGRCIEHIFVYNGKGRNGKGLINQSMRLALGDYYCNSAVCIITESNKFKQSSGPNPEKAKLDKARYVVMKEPDKATPIQNSTVKDITGGGTIQARACHSNSTDCELHLTLCLETNAKPPVAEEAQGADFDRWIDYEFVSKFTADESKWDESKYVFPIDPNLKKREWWITRRNAFMKILMERLTKLHNRNYVLADIVPDAIRQRTLEYLQGSFQIHRWFLACFEPRRDDVDYGENDKDYTIHQVATVILKSDSVAAVPYRERQKVTLKTIKEYFLDNNDYFAGCIKKHGNSHILLGYREAIDEELLQEVTDEETDESSDFLMEDDDST